MTTLVAVQSRCVGLNLPIAATETIVKNLRANTTQTSTMVRADSDSSADWCRMEVSFLSYSLAVLVPIIFYLGIVSPQLGFVGLLVGVGIIVEVIWAITRTHTDRSEPSA